MMESAEGAHLSTTRHYLSLAVSLGWQDVRDTYQRSTLGPLWMTIALGVQVTAIGLVFGLLFGADLTLFFPFLAISLTLWGFVVSSVTDSTGAYVQSQQIVKQMFVPSFFPVVRVLSKNLIVFAHNLSIVAIVMAVFGVVPNLSVLLFFPGLILVTAVIYVVSVVAATISARFRDVPPIISSVLMVSFYITPIIWMPESLPGQFRNIVLTWNPFYHLMELIRSPLLGSAPSALNWGASVGIFAVLGLFAWWVSKKYSWKIVYWL
jgi:ABC-type polysaccharide/polyol phosphate export permease